MLFPRDCPSSEGPDSRKLKLNGSPFSSAPGRRIIYCMSETVSGGTFAARTLFGLPADADEVVLGVCVCVELLAQSSSSSTEGNGLENKCF